jgi:hypothetical protein
MFIRSSTRLLCVFSFLSVTGFAQQGTNDAFNIQTLPRGKEVTLPRPALTIVPVSEKIRLSSTDMPQSLKISSNGAQSSFKVAIYDTNSERVKYIELKPGVPYLYNFKDLSTISLVPQTHTITTPAASSLRIESNKPLSISRN